MSELIYFYSFTLVLALTIILCLLLLGYINPCITLQNRYMFVSIAGLIGWVFFVYYSISHFYTIRLVDIISTTMFLLASILAIGVFWSLICWGFTTSLLVALSCFHYPISADLWYSSYSSGSTITDFTNDRLSILIRLGLVARSSDDILIPGSIFAKVLSFTYRSLLRIYRINQSFI